MTAAVQQQTTLLSQRPAQAAAVRSATASPATGSWHFELVHDVDQTVTRTRSRTARPRAWLRAVCWLIGAGAHPRAGSTTMSVAKDLAQRMDYERGLVLYDLQGTARRLGVSTATVKRHVALLRQMGALVWLRHGSKRNLHLPGRKYTATATIYGAAIPPAYDTAMGHRISGEGYEARIVGVTEAGRDIAIAAARQRARQANNSSPQQGSSAGREPHSRGSTRMSEKAKVSGGCKDTSRKRATSNTTPTRPTTGHEKRRSAAQVARDCQVASRVRPMLDWTQREGLRRLAFALRPLIDAGLTCADIAAELHSWYLTWRPTQPAAYITARLRAQPEETAPPAAGGQGEWTAMPWQRPQEAEVAQLVDEAFARMRHRTAQSGEALPNFAVGRDGLTDLEQLTRGEVLELRAAAQKDPSMITMTVETCGETYARRLYTHHLVDQTLRLGNARHMSVHRTWEAA